MSRSQRFLLPVFVLGVLSLLLTGVRGAAPPPAAFHSSFGRGPTIALVHGLGSRASHWLPTARLLARNHRVVLIELPGHGTSAMPEEFSLEQAARSLDQALAAESRDPVILVGHSVGGLVAAAEAIENPSRVLGLVLVETALRPQVYGAERAAMLQALDQDYSGLLRAAYTTFGRDSAQGAALYAEAAELDSTSLKPWIRLALTADLSLEMRGLEAPALAILAERSWGDGEPWPQTALVLGYDHVAQLAVLRVRDTGHFVMLDHPAEVASAIERFAAQPFGELIAGR